MHDRALQSDRLALHVADLISEHDVSKDSKTQFGLFITSMIPWIDDSLLTSYMDQAYGLLMRYVHRTEQMSQQQLQQSYQSQQQFQQQQYPVQQYPQQQVQAPQFQQPQQFTQHHYPQQQQPWLHPMTPSIVDIRPAPVSTMTGISSRTSVAVTASCPGPQPSMSSTATSTSSVISADSMPTLELMEPATPFTPSVLYDYIDLDTPKPPMQFDRS